MEGRNWERIREIDYVLLSAFGIIGTVLSSRTRQFELTLQREWFRGGGWEGERGHRDRRKRKEDKGWWGRLAGRQRGRVRVWWEDREIDRITGFRSRTERDGRRQRRERERGRVGGFRVRKAVSICQTDTKQHAKPHHKKKKKNPPGCYMLSFFSIDNLRNSALNIHLKRWIDWTEIHLWE